MISNYLHHDPNSFNLEAAALALLSFLWAFTFTPYYARFYHFTNYAVHFIRISSRVLCIFLGKPDEQDLMQIVYFSQILSYSISTFPVYIAASQFIYLNALFARFYFEYDEIQPEHLRKDSIRLYLIFVGYISVLLYQISNITSKYNYDRAEKQKFLRINKVNIENEPEHHKIN